MNRSTAKNKKITPKKQIKLDEIVESARNFFILHNATGFSIADLAKHLNMTQANVYHYVHSKRDLWFAISLQTQYEIQGEITKYMGKNISAFDKIMLMVKQFLDYVKRNPDKIYFSYKTNVPSGKDRGPFESERLTKFANGNLEIFKKVLEQGRQSGEFSANLNVERMVFFYWSFIYGAVNFYLIGTLHDSIEKNGTVSYQTTKLVENWERDIINIIEEDLSKYLQ